MYTEGFNTAVRVNQYILLRNWPYDNVCCIVIKSWGTFYTFMMIPFKLGYDESLDDNKYMSFMTQYTYKSVKLTM